MVLGTVGGIRRSFFAFVVESSSGRWVVEPCGETSCRGGVEASPDGKRMVEEADRVPGGMNLRGCKVPGGTSLVMSSRSRTDC